jgi:hypothetical protein
MDRPRNRIRPYLQGKQDPFQGEASTALLPDDEACPSPPIADQPSVDDDWQPNLSQALVEFIESTTKRMRQVLIFRQIESRLVALEDRPNQLCCPVTITTFAPEPFRLKRDIPVLIRPDGDEFTALFVDANIGSSGETISEAVDNLKDIILSLFKKFAGMDAAKLGPGPTRQLAVLNEFIDPA